MTPATPKAPVRNAALSAWYDARPASARQAFSRRLVRALRDLLDLGSDVTVRVPSPPAQSWPTLLGALSDAVARCLGAPEYPHGVEETETLIRALTQPIGEETLTIALVTDVAEIVALPRQARWEYVSHPLQTPPWNIRKLLLEYAILARALDDLVGVLNKGFCASRCDRLPVGCCHILGYDLGLVPEGMLAAQALEARWQASAGRPWRPPGASEVEHTCRYHTASGCVLARFKSPACIGYLCPALERDLDRRFPSEPLRALRRALREFRNQDIDRRRVFEAMARLLRSGEALRAASDPKHN